MLTKYEIARDAEPQVSLLLLAIGASIGIWILSLFLPFVGYVLYPLQLFATFVHEGGHVLATLITGNSVQSMTVAPDTSGAVFSQTTGWFAPLFISSAGYLGTTIFGAGLLAWMRYGFSSRTALYAAAGFVAILTVLFGLFAPIFSFFETVTVGGVFFTLISGAFLAAVLFLIAKFAALKWANFALAFLAVQCLLNAIFSIVDLFFIASFTDGHSDAANMAAATGIPAAVWAVLWFGISLAIILAGIRVYAVKKGKSAELLFND
jgi:hypothetical protein